jgi:hypothetical protein
VQQSYTCTALRELHNRFSKYPAYISFFIYFATCILGCVSKLTAILRQNCKGRCHEVRGMPGSYDKTELYFRMTKATIALLSKKRELSRLLRKF